MSLPCYVWVYPFFKFIFASPGHPEIIWPPVSSLSADPAFRVRSILDYVTAIAVVERLWSWAAIIRPSVSAFNLVLLSHWCVFCWSTPAHFFLWYLLYMVIILFLVGRVLSTLFPLLLLLLFPLLLSIQFIFIFGGLYRGINLQAICIENWTPTSENLENLKEIYFLYICNLESWINSNMKK